MRKITYDNNPKITKMIELVNEDTEAVVVTLCTCSKSYRKD